MSNEDASIIEISGDELAEVRGGIDDDSAYGDRDVLIAAAKCLGLDGYVDWGGGDGGASAGDGGAGAGGSE